MKAREREKILKSVKATSLASNRSQLTSSALSQLGGPAFSIN
jgi:hypothetical protein